jgi:hypothetical protein
MAPQGKPVSQVPRAHSASVHSAAKASGSHQAARALPGRCVPRSSRCHAAQAAAWYSPRKAASASTASAASGAARPP